MLGNYREKMVVLSSITATTNEWQQNHIDEKGLMASTGIVFEKPSQDQQHKQQQQQQQQPLKCPRCDSSNTKFCYYNNYSLSQPRHFCKACKRYWTRGGTLRNVPVGGGCRKHKRVKRPAIAIEAPLSSASTAPQNPSVQPHVDLFSSSSTHINPLFYGLPTNPPELNFPFPRLNSRVTSIDAVSGFNLQPQLSNVLGLGFSSGLMGTDINNDNNYRNGGFNSSKRIQDVITSNPLLSSYPILGSANSNSTSTPASLIASSLQQQKLVSSGFKDMQGANSFQGLLPFENRQMAGHGEGGTMMKEVKMEGGQNRLDWDIHNQNQIEQNNSPDPSIWNTASVGAWLDPSVPSLI